MSERERRAAIAAGLTLLPLLVWHGVLFGAFHYDDLPNVVLDPATSEPSAFLERVATGFRPLLRLSYFLDHALWGMRPGGFLATNLALHVVAVVTLFFLARRRLGGDLPAAVAAAVFAVAPAHAEVVAWVSGRSSGMAAALLLLALLFYERSDRIPVASIAIWALAVLAKETALVFPALLLVWEGTRPEPRPGAARRLAPFFAAGIVLFGVVLASPRLRELLSFSLSLRSPFESLAANAVALPASLSLWGRPWALSIEHPEPLFTPMRAAAGGALVLFAATGAILLRRRFPHAALAVLFPLVAFLPTHSIVAKLDPVTAKPLYLAWVGPALLAGALAARVPRRREILTALGFAILAGGIQSAKRVEVWQDPLRLWTEAVDRAPGSARAWNNLGMARFERGDLDGADLALARALEIDPRRLRAFETRLTIRLLRETSPPRAGETR